MSHTVAQVLALALVAVLPGCNRTLHLEVPTGTPVHLVTDLPIRSDGLTPDKDVLLQTDAPGYKGLQEWIAHNQGGWSQSLATNPGGGVRVHAGSLHLQFVDGVVFTWISEGQFQKDIKEEDYAFLKKAAGI
jgi:hypothetical protein